MALEDLHTAAEREALAVLVSHDGISKSDLRDRVADLHGSWPSQSKYDRAVNKLEEKDYVTDVSDSRETAFVATDAGLQAFEEYQDWLRSLSD